MQHLRAEFTEVWAPSKLLPLIHFADAKHGIQGTGLDLVGVGDIEFPPPLLDRLRHFDSIISWYGSNREDFRAAVEREHLPFHFFPALPSPRRHQHAIDFFCEQVGARPGSSPVLPVPDVPKRDSLVVHPFSGSTRKNWPLQNFEEVVDGLSCPVEWLAGPEQDLPNAHRFDDLWELACWLAGSGAYLGNDSGITHIAAAVNIPTISIFGPTDPAVWGPRGSKVIIRRSERIRDLQASAILQEVLHALRHA
jgi:hypothetical protein